MKHMQIDMRAVDVQSRKDRSASQPLILIIDLLMHFYTCLGFKAIDLENVLLVWTRCNLAFTGGKKNQGIILIAYP
jgi:hypothetical protein